MIVVEQHMSMMPHVQNPEALSARFRKTGRKVTPQRQCIFRLLQGNRSHPSAEALFEEARREMAAISLKTVYQTLHELADLGEVARLDVGTGSARFDPNVEHAHHHLVCRGCGKVRDIASGVPELRLPGAEVQGYVVGSAEVVFRGLCRECRNGDQAAQVPGTGGRPVRTSEHCNSRVIQTIQSSSHPVIQSSSHPVIQSSSNPENPREEQEWQS